MRQQVPRGRSFRRVAALPPLCSCGGVDRDAQARFAEKLLAEATLLHAVGLLDRNGSVHCRDCGAIVERSTGWAMRFSCLCGWRMEDVDDGCL